MDTSVQSFGCQPVATHDPLRIRLRAEFLEMPGMTLSLDQAVKLFGVDAKRCRAVLAELVDSGFLANCDGQFRRASELRRRGLR